MIDVKQHPAYDSSLRHAAKRALDNKGDCFSVWYDGEAVYVRASEAVKPPNSTLVCIAQHWADTRVQLRFNGAWSEWIDF
jgi:hypothetical protein